MTAITSTITAAPVEIPAGFRATKGTITIDTNTYASGGFDTTVAQWGGGVGNVPARYPDFVLFSGGQEGVAASSSIEPVNFVRGATGRVAVYGTALTDDVGITEEAGEAMSAATWTYLAFWVNADSPAATSIAYLSAN